MRMLLLAALLLCPDGASGDVPQWAKDQYIAESPTTLTVSMTRDKKIGSIYFKDEGRIRTTHTHGPKETQIGKGTTVLQFNINQKTRS